MMAKNCLILRNICYLRPSFWIFLSASMRQKINKNGPLNGLKKFRDDIENAYVHK
jgi:hypothetical protein